MEVTFPVSPQRARNCQISALVINIIFRQHTIANGALKHQFKVTLTKCDSMVNEKENIALKIF